MNEKAMNEHLRKIQRDVDDMNKSFGMEVADAKTEPPSTNEPEPEPEPEPDVETDPPTTDEPAEPKTDPPKTEAPTTDAPDDKDKIIEDLRKKLAEKDAPKPSTKAPTTEAPLTLDELDLVGDLDVESLTEDKSELNELLNKIRLQAVKDSKSVYGKSADIDLPNAVNAVITLQKATEKFYEDNKDLEPFKKAVGATFEDLASLNPNKKYGELLEMVAPEARKRLNLPEPKTKKADDKGDPPPRLPRKKGKSGAPEVKETKTTQTSQIDEMNKSLGR